MATSPKEQNPTSEKSEEGVDKAVEDTFPAAGYTAARRRKARRRARLSTHSRMEANSCIQRLSSTRTKRRCWSTLSSAA
jgi:hypothetical protein